MQRISPIMPGDAIARQASRYRRARHIRVETKAGTLSPASAGSFRRPRVTEWAGSGAGCAAAVLLQSRRSWLAVRWTRTSLIKVLAADAAVISLRFFGESRWPCYLRVIAFAAPPDPRPDIAAAAQMPRFRMKLVISIALALSACCAGTAAGRELALPSLLWPRARAVGDYA
jgi:hypothetical protein